MDFSIFSTKVCEKKFNMLVTTGGTGMKLARSLRVSTVKEPYMM